LTPRPNGRVLLDVVLFDDDLRGAESYMPALVTFGDDPPITFFEYWKPRPGGRGWVTRNGP